MLLVIDSNVYILAFGLSKESKAQDLFSKILGKLSIYKEFNKFINSLTTVDEDFVVPFEIAFKYENQGLKTSDAFIAAYTEWVSADCLVTENRHFLSLQSDLPFKVLTSEKCLKLI